MERVNSVQYDQLKNNLGIIAVFAASVLVIRALTTTPSYASGNGHKDKNGVSGDGKTNIKLKNVGAPYLSGSYNND